MTPSDSADSAGADPYAELLDYGRRLGAGLDHLHAGGAPELAATAREVICRADKLTLYRYLPRVPAPQKTPLLIVYALVNRPTMTDLQPDRSLVRGLLDAGLDVYLIDWGYPDRADRLLTLDDYVNGYLHDCVETVCARHGLPAIHVLGICQGGVLSLAYAALHPGRVRNLIPMVTPVDFHVPEFLLTKLVRPLDLELMIGTLGNMPGPLLNFLFLSLSPFRQGRQKYVHVADLAEDPGALANFVRMEHWIYDCPDLAGTAFREFVTATFHDNRLVRGDFEIGGRRVDPARLLMPMLNIYATRDHIVPPQSSQALRRLYGGRDYSEIAFDGGHIGIYVSRQASRQIAPAIADWLRSRG